MAKKRLLTIGLTILLLIACSGYVFADTIKTMVLTVPELTPGNAPQAVEALERLDGVEKAETDLENTSLTVTYVEYEAGLYDFRRALEDIGLTITSAVDSY